MNEKKESQIRPELQEHIQSQPACKGLGKVFYPKMHSRLSYEEASGLKKVY